MSTERLAELTEFMEQAGWTPYVWEMRGDEVWIRHIASGGIDDPVYDYSRYGSIDALEQSIHNQVSNHEQSVTL